MSAKISTLPANVDDAIQRINEAIDQGDLQLADQISKTLAGTITITDAAAIKALRNELRRLEQRAYAEKSKAVRSLSSMHEQKRKQRPATQNQIRSRRIADSTSAQGSGISTFAQKSRGVSLTNTTDSNGKAFPSVIKHRRSAVAGEYRRVQQSVFVKHGHM